VVTQILQTVRSSSHLMRIGRGNSGTIEWLSLVADVEVNASRVVALSKDVRPHEEKVVMTTKVRIHLFLSGISVW
jgi:hypothetical protein